MLSSQLATLGHPQRLSIFRLLMRRYPGRVSAGEIATTLGLKPSTLSAYLNALMAVGLVSQTRIGTSRHYAIALDTVREALGHLLFDCCRGRPDLCMPGGATRPDQPTAKARPYAVLFLCTGNSARSIFAESILRQVAGDRFTAYSAGTRPRAGPNPFALDVLRDKGHDVSLSRAKTIDEFRGPHAPKLDFVFTVCDHAANEDCPAWEGQPITAHWGMPDPVATEGTDAQKSLAFHQAYGALKNRIESFAALPFAELDRIALQGAVDALVDTAQVAHA